MAAFSMEELWSPNGLSERTWTGSLKSSVTAMGMIVARRAWSGDGRGSSVA